ncbi:DUF6443 domain-containing protein [Flavobacterium sp. J372]|uniref:DUF6443 domain-containing protein n=1 Tax=Flavobacterium sp. J372 TaxID=2898436 RepID=UPI0021515CF0|nr:DUF6443 domain-containing protein [Flavobacterium sp. J372]MCR5861007.1 DUF6443 domain-containing protein [Flavobacterium sp. J372]
MKKIINLLLLLPVLALGQTPTENYVRTRVYKEETSSSDPSKANAAVTYYDGLGRPIQQVAGKASGVGTDIITHIEYDAYGRQIKEYLPYKSGNTGLEFVTDAKTATLNFYNTQAYESTQNPYSEKKLESSPLSRVLKTAAPGNPWKIDVGQNITFAYASNGENEVLKFAANATWNSTTELYDAAFVADGYYAPGALYRTQITDENGVVTREYKNKEGQLVCKINAKGSEDLVTYYIYDQYGNLSFVLPPLAEGTLDPGLCYYYKYDKRNRLVEKRYPLRAGSIWYMIGLTVLWPPGRLTHRLLMVPLAGCVPTMILLTGCA